MKNEQIEPKPRCNYCGGLNSHFNHCIYKRKVLIIPKNYDIVKVGKRNENNPKDKG